jgi:hypothetical protein
LALSVEIAYFTFDKPLSVLRRIARLKKKEGRYWPQNPSNINMTSLQIVVGNEIIVINSHQSDVLKRLKTFYHIRVLTFVTMYCNLRRTSHSQLTFFKENN